MAAPYTKTPWVEDVTKTSPTNLGNMESGIFLASAPVVTSLPVSPVDGQECNYVADATAGVIWHLVYRSASGKWHYVGGPPLYSEIAGADATTSGVYVALGTAGPSLVIPLTGDYDVEVGSRAYAVSAALGAAFHSYDIGGTAASDNDALLEGPAASGGAAAGSRLRRKTGLAAGATLVSKYRTNSNIQWDNRWMRVLPVKVS